MEKPAKKTSSRRQIKKSTKSAALSRPSERGPRKKAAIRQQSGQATSQIVHASAVSTSAEMFPSILSLHVPVGSKVADVTFGKGVFWRQVAPEQYQVFGSDLALEPEVPKQFPHLKLKDGIDFSHLPYNDCEMDAVVLDPPYMEGFYRQEKSTRAGQGTHQAFRNAYSGGKETKNSKKNAVGRLAWQDRVVDAYVDAAHEAWRVLRQEGVLIVKCQDAVSANIQRLAHVEIITAFEEMGFYTKDLFVLVRPGKASVSSLRTQVHARKNHSFFLVFVKPKKQLVISCRTCREPSRKG